MNKYIHTEILVMHSFITTFVLSSAIGLGYFFYQAYWVQPYSGSQTRTGGFLEREFGWNDHFYGFESPHFKIVKNIDELTSDIDLLVVGDSFSHNEQISWLNFLNSQQERKITFIHIDNISAKDLLNHTFWSTNPPRQIVFQSMEGSALRRWSQWPQQELSVSVGRASPSKEKPLIWNVADPGPDFMKKLQRNKAMPYSQKVAVYGRYTKAFFMRSLHLDFSPTYRVEIECEDCFSHQASHQLLLNKANMASKIPLWPQAVLGMRAMKKNLEKYGKTRVYYIIFPNKASVYKDYITSKNHVSLLESNIISNNLEGVDFINLLPAFRQAVSRGMKDLYLPNDHHCSARGYKLAAQVASISLQQPKPLVLDSTQGSKSTLIR